MPYRIAGIDVHKKMLAVVVTDVETRRRVPLRSPEGRDEPRRPARLADWLVSAVEEVVMESTAQYWRPVWEALEQYWRPGAARARSPPAVGHASSRPSAIESWPWWTQEGLPDAERLVKRLVAQELTLSFVPDAEQRLWRTVMRRRY